MYILELINIHLRIGKIYIIHIINIVHIMRNVIPSAKVLLYTYAWLGMKTY